MWIGTCITAAACLVFLLWYFRWGDDHLSADKRRVLAFVIALAAGAFGNFLAGDVTLNISGELHAGWKFGIQATGAIALFVLTLVLFRDVLVQQPPIDPAPSGEAKDLLGGHLSDLTTRLETANVTVGRQTQEIEELTKQRDEALDMARQGKADGDPLAIEAVAEYERNGDMAGLQRLLTERKKKPKADLLNLNRKLAAVAYLRGDIDTAMATVKEILALDPDDLQGRNQLGHIHKLRGNLEEAERAYKRVLRVAKRHKDKGGQAAAYGNLGLIYQTRGELDEAERMQRKALEINEKLGRMEGMANQYGNLGVIYQTRGDLDEAERMHRKALGIEKKLERMEGMAIQYGNLGTVAKQQDDADEARRLWTQARDLFAKIGMLHMVERVQGWLDE